MKKKILIFTATYNESENIINFLNTINLLNINIDLLIVDDNSPDKTSEVIENYNSKNVKINLLKREKKLGLDSAHKLAYTYAVTNEYDYLITMDTCLTIPRRYLFL